MKGGCPWLCYLQADPEPCQWNLQEPECPPGSWTLLENTVMHKWIWYSRTSRPSYFHGQSSLSFHNNQALPTARHLFGTCYSYLENLDVGLQVPSHKADLPFLWLALFCTCRIWSLHFWKCLMRTVQSVPDEVSLGLCTISIHAGNVSRINSLTICMPKRCGWPLYIKQKLLRGWKETWAIHQLCVWVFLNNTKPDYGLFVWESSCDRVMREECFTFLIWGTLKMGFSFWNWEKCRLKSQHNGVRTKNDLQVSR